VILQPSGGVNTVISREERHGFRGVFRSRHDLPATSGGRLDLSLPSDLERLLR